MREAAGARRQLAYTAMTYVSDSLMHANQIAYRDAANDFRARHAKTIADIGDSIVWPRNEAERSYEIAGTTGAKSLLDEACVLLSQPAFARAVGEEDNLSLTLPSSREFRADPVLAAMGEAFFSLPESPPGLVCAPIWR